MQKNISSNPTQITFIQPIEKNRDMSVAPAQCVFYGRCMPQHLIMGEMKFPDYEAKPCWREFINFSK